jgi:hypothetical protein
MNDRLDYFANVRTAMLWLIGVRAACRTPSPTNLRSMRLTLLDGGSSVLLCADSNCGHVSCVADLPRQMTEEECYSLDWWGEPEAGDEEAAEELASMKPAGSA